MAAMLTWHGFGFSVGGYGWNGTGVWVMSERHPGEEHPLRGPGEEAPAQEEPQEGEEDGEKEEEKV